MRTFDSHNQDNYLICSLIFFNCPSYPTFTIALWPLAMLALQKALSFLKH